MLFDTSLWRVASRKKADLDLVGIMKKITLNLLLETELNFTLILVLNWNSKTEPMLVAHSLCFLKKTKMRFWAQEVIFLSLTLSGFGRDK